MPPGTGEVEEMGITRDAFRLQLQSSGWLHWPAMLLFPAVLFYYELVFKTATTGGLLRPGTLITLFFCGFYGCLCYLLVTLCRPGGAARRVSAALIALAALPYAVEYFVFRAFQIFYDLNTIVGGAGDALGSFGGDIVRLLLSPGGLLTLALLALPTFLFVRYGAAFLPVMEANARRRAAAAAGGLLCACLGLLLIDAVPDYRQLYWREYNYQNAVSSFGLLPAMRMDLGAQLAPQDLYFELPSPTAAPAATPRPTAQPTAAPQASPTPTVTPAPTFAPHALPIDFDALAAQGSHALAEMDAYVASLTPSRCNEYTGLFAGKNLIMITAEAFTAEVIDPDLTPTLYRMATRGIQFTDYYQPASAGTTGGEYQNLMGLLPSAGGRSFKKAAGNALPLTIGHQLDRLGYYGMAYHNNTYTYYDRDRTHIKLGYSGGYMGYGNGMEEYVTWQWPESDLEMIAGTLPTYLDRQPFNIYYMSVSGHSAYGRNSNAMAAKNWDKVEQLPYSEPVKAYLAANLELENAMAYLLDALEEAGIADDTVICIGADHFPYGLDSGAALGEMTHLSELYGYNVRNYFQRDHNRLILWCGSLEKEAPIIVDSPTFSLDILPTLSNLFGVEFDSRLLPGRDVFSDAEPLVFNTAYEWKTELGTYAGGHFTPAAEGADIPEDYVKRMNAVVRNKIEYCKGVLDNDYYAHVFGSE